MNENKQVEYLYEHINIIETKCNNQAKEIRRLLKQKDELKSKVDKYESLEWANKFRNADILNSQMKKVSEENKRLKNCVCYLVLKLYKDNLDLLSNDLKDIIANRVGQDQEIERLLGKGDNQ